VAHIGDRIEVSEAFHHHLADGRGLDLALTHILQAANDAGDHLVELFLGDRTLLEGDGDRAAQLVALEQGPAAVALDHGEVAELNALERCEPATALRTTAATANGSIFLSRTAVLHHRVGKAAIRAAHVIPRKSSI